MSDLTNDLHSTKPTPKGLVDHQRLEKEAGSKSGVESLLNSQQGYIVGRMGDELMRFNTDTHLLTISPSGGGKGTGLIIPNLIDHPGSAFVIDIRGETVAKTATARMLQGQHIVVLDPYNITDGKWGRDRYNPFDAIIENLNKDSSDDLIQRLTKALMYDPSGRQSNEPIWDNATQSLLSGIITLIVRYWRPKRKHLIEILDVLNYTPEEREIFTDKLKALIQANPKAQEDRQLKGLLSLMTDAKSNTKITDNALIQAQTLLSWAGNRAFSKVLKNSTFSFGDLAGGNMTVYMVIPEEFMGNCATWVRMILESATFSIPDVFNSMGINTSELRQQDRVLFLLDELSAFGDLDIISSGMATVRGRGINLWLFIQNIAQLEAVYGKEKTRVIMGNTSSLQVFGSTEIEELEYFSKVIGEEFHDVQSFTRGITITEGNSETIGSSETVSNSESVSNTNNSSDSTSQAKTINWSKAYTKSKNTAKSNSTSKSRSSGSSYSRTRGNTNNYDRSSLLGSGYQGYNRNRSRTRQNSTNSGKTWQRGKTKTTGTSDTKSKGGGETTTSGHTIGHSSGTTHQKGNSNSSSQSHTINHSEANNRSVTVKQQRMKIETSRMIRDKISGRNQLLFVKGSQPFFAPKMAYFVKFLDKDRYMFPDIAAMSSVDFFSQTSDLPVLKQPITNVLPNLLDKPSFQNVKKHIAEAAQESGISFKPNMEEAVKEFYQLLSEGLIELPQKRKEQLSKINRSHNFDEPVLMMANLCEVLHQNWHIPELLKIRDRVIDLILEFETEKQRPDDLEQLYKPFKNINTDNISVENLKAISLRDSKVESNYRWMLQTYAPIVKTIFDLYDDPEQGARKRLTVFEQIRLNLRAEMEKLATLIQPLIEKAYDQQLEYKQQFNTPQTN